MHKPFLKALNEQMKQEYGYSNFVSEEEFKLWDQLEKAWNMVHAMEEQVNLWKENQFLDQKRSLEKLGKIYLTTYPSVHYSWYLHYIVCHTIMLWERFGSLLKWTNQGSESSNFHHRVTLNRIGTQGGLKRSEIEDLLLHGVRMNLYEESKTMVVFEKYLHEEFDKRHEIKTTKKREVARAKRALPTIQPPVPVGSPPQVPLVSTPLPQAPPELLGVPPPHGPLHTPLTQPPPVPVGTFGIPPPVGVPPPQVPLRTPFTQPPPAPVGTFGIPPFGNLSPFGSFPPVHPSGHTSSNFSTFRGSPNPPYPSGNLRFTNPPLHFLVLISLKEGSPIHLCPQFQHP